MNWFVRIFLMDSITYTGRSLTSSEREFLSSFEFDGNSQRWHENKSGEYVGGCYFFYSKSSYGRLRRDKCTRCCVVMVTIESDTKYRNTVYYTRNQLYIVLFIANARYYQKRCSKHHEYSRNNVGHTFYSIYIHNFDCKCKTNSSLNRQI